MKNVLRNAWYCAGWAEDIATKPKGIRILGDYLVLYRGTGDVVRAMSGRCPHRFAPLNMGVVQGDTITCGYHGLQFAADGRCVFNPHGDGIIPPQARLDTYPAEERNGAIWVWMGDPERATSASLPPETVLQSEDYSSVRTYLNVGANYQLVIDNLLDLTHAPFLHRETLAGEMPDKIRHEFSVDGDVVHSDYFIDNYPPAPQMATLFDDQQGDFSARMTWRPASILELDIWQRPLSRGSARALNLPSLHYITPETEHRTHYFASIGRNVKTDNAEEDAIMERYLMRAFLEEDEPMVRACQDLMETTDLFSLKPAILQTDVAAVQARRLLSKRIKAEASQSVGQ